MKMEIWVTFDHAQEVGEDVGAVVVVDCGGTINRDEAGSVGVVADPRG